MQLLSDKLGIKHQSSDNEKVYGKFIRSYYSSEFITFHASDWMPVLCRHQKKTSPHHVQLLTTPGQIITAIIITWLPRKPQTLEHCQWQGLWDSLNQENRIVNPDAILRTVKSKQPITLDRARRWTNITFSVDIRIKCIRQIKGWPSNIKDIESH